MNAPFDNDKLAAYALGELDEADRAEVKAYLDRNDEAARLVEEYRAAARIAAEALRVFEPLKLHEPQREKIMQQARGYKPLTLWGRQIRSSSILAAATIVLLLGIVSVITPRTMSYKGQAADYAKKAARMQETLGRMQNVASAPAPAPATVPPEVARQLKDLGYSPAAGRSLSEKPDALAAPSQIQGAAPDRYLVKNAQVSLECDNPRDAAAKFAASAAAAGGYVGNLQENMDALGRGSVTIQVRVPADKLDAAIADMETLGRVINKTVNTEDVTDQYVDTEARIRNLKATEERLLDHLAKSSAIENTLKIENEITRVHEQLERLEGMFRVLSHRVEFSTINATFSQKPKDEPKLPPATFSSMKVFSEATRSLVEFGQRLWTRAIWLGVWSPAWAPILVVLLLVFRWLRKRETTGV